ncbi:MAG: prefoldin subunit alpha [Thermoplasmata archaeon]
MTSEQELREKVGRLEVINSQLDVLEEQIGYINQLINDHNEAIKTFEKYSQEEEGSEMMVPVGANSRVYCKVGNTDKVLIGLGADISAETNVEKATEILEKRKKELTSNRSEMENNLNKLNTEYQKLESEVREEYQELQSQSMKG